MKCVLGTTCPVLHGECDRDGECYVFRCENPHAPKPQKDEVLGEFANLLLTVNAARMEF